MSKAIAVVEDDESIREMLRYYFQSVGYAVRAYESGEALFAGEEGLGLPDGAEKDAVGALIAELDKLAAG